MNVLTTELAKMVAERVGGVGDEGICIAYRMNGDFRYDATSIGVIAFTAKSWDETYFIYPFSHPAAAEVVGEAVLRETIHCVNTARVQQKLEETVGKIEPAPRLVEVDGTTLCSRKKSPAVGAEKILSTKLGVKYCPRHSHDEFHTPKGFRAPALLHLASEVQCLVDCL